MEQINEGAKEVIVDLQQRIIIIPEVVRCTTVVVIVATSSNFKVDTNDVVIIATFRMNSFFALNKTELENFTFISILGFMETPK